MNKTQIESLERIIESNSKWMEANAENPEASREYPTIAASTMQAIMRLAEIQKETAGGSAVEGPRVIPFSRAHLDEIESCYLYHVQVSMSDQKLGLIVINIKDYAKECRSTLEQIKPVGIQLTIKQD